MSLSLSVGWWGDRDHFFKNLGLSPCRMLGYVPRSDMGRGTCPSAIDDFIASICDPNDLRLLILNIKVIEVQLLT